MRTKVLLTVAVVAMLALGGAVMASNMGFKISIPFTAGQPKYVSVPNYCTVNGVTIEGGTAVAANLRNELITAGSGGAAGQTPVYYYTGNAWQRYAGGGIGQVNFTLAPGIGYQCVTTAGINWIVVGSHNPSLSISFTAGQPKYVAVPYHTTSTTAQLLRNELISAGSGGAAGQTPVYYYTGNAWQRYAGGGIGQVNFNLAAGNAYQAVTTAGISWTPAHY